MNNPHDYDGMVLRIRPVTKGAAAKPLQMATAETSKARLAICHSCKELRRPIDQCKLCGCFMQVKARLQSSKCPAGKW
jgi:hypothetical protein